ncbi:MAG: A/G-specific adenine glycosylase [Alphaproteobacteria bacterium]|jgi:A/G-specific adenine glycosylase
MNNFASHLLSHYKKNARDLPWRRYPTPYNVWLSEIMLQQTTVTTVIPYFEKFTNTYKTVQALAKASEDDIMHLWQGLGYYSRARNLHKCAKIIAENGGTFPSDEAALLKLPGVGPYTAAAISSIAFNKKATVVDGNVERVMSRLQRTETALPKAKAELGDKARTLTPNKENNLYSNAIMELGALICTPRKPKCATCPVTKFCDSYGKDDIESYPRKEPKKAKKVDHGTVYIIRDRAGLYYLQKRPGKGLLASLWEFPSTSWAGESTHLPNFMETIKEDAEHMGQIRHIFTHIDLTFDVMLTEVDKLENGFNIDNLPPLPTLMKKALKLAC